MIMIKNMMKTWLAIFGALLFAQTAGAAANAESIVLAVGETVQRTMSVASAGTWSVSTQGDSKICSVSGFSTDRASSKTITFTGVASGTTTWKFSRGSNNSWEYTIIVVEPLAVNLCVGDKVLFGQRPSDTSYYWMNESSESAVASVNQTTRTTSTSANLDATITALKEGSADIRVGWYTRSGNNGNYTYTLAGCNLYRVTVGAARSVNVGKTVDATCVTPTTGTAWSKTDGDKAKVTLSTTSPTADSTTATITGTAAGATSVEVTDYNNGNSAKTGATYTLAVNVVDLRTRHEQDVSLELGNDVLSVTNVICATPGDASEWTAKSASESIATVAIVNGKEAQICEAKITAKAAGATMVTVENATDVYVFNVTVTQPLVMNLCVGDEVTVGYRSSSSSGNNWSASSSDASTVSVGTASSTQRNFSTTLSALKEGSALVSIANGSTAQTPIRVNVAAARVVKIGSQYAVTESFVSPYNNNNWTVSSDNTGSLTATKGTTSGTSADVTLTGVARGTAHVTVSNVETTYNRGAKYVLAVEVKNAKPDDPEKYGVALTEGGKAYQPTQLSGPVESAKSSNVQVAEVDEKTGAIKPVWLGDATVTIEDQDYVRTYNVTVTNTKTTQLNIDFDTESSKALTFPSGEGMYWTVSKDDPDGVIALDKLSQTTAATQTFELKVTPNRTGKATFRVVAEKTVGMTSVKYGDYTYNVWVTAMPSGDRQSTAVMKVDGEATLTCPDKCSEKKVTWKVKSGYDAAAKAVATLEVVNTTATVRPQVKVTKALKPGRITLVIGSDDDDHTWTLDIVVKKYEARVLELDTADEATRVVTEQCEGALAGSWSVASSYESVARAEIVGDASGAACEVRIIGISEGKTVITVQNEFATYEYSVSVKGAYVPSTAETVEYSYTDADGKTQTAKIGYEGAVVKRVASADGRNTDLVLVFTNTAEISKLEIPSPKIFRARILAVGGGGAGGTQVLPGLGGGGGGAGGYMENDAAILSAGYYYVTVGQGGTNATAKITAATGMNGGISVVTNSAGQVLASAVGGGGGGASIAMSIGGQSGGSGGGGAWVNNFTTAGGNGAGGNGRDGQGHRGGKPADEPANFNNGGGGGGASTVSNFVNGAWVFLGEGGTHGEAGLGATNDITGAALEYARGGIGGKNNSTAKAEPGLDGRGNGGAGGNGGFGGKGGDGIVIVRLTSVFENIQVPMPTVANKGLFTEKDEDGKSEFAFKDSYGAAGHWFDSFNSNAVVKAIKNGTEVEVKYADIVKYVDGWPGTNAWMTTAGGTNVYHNLGHYQYVIYLKDGYSWIDGSPYGSTAGCLIDWRITKDLKSVDATIRVEKSVNWAEDGSNAVITITSHSTPAQNPITPKVLFIGTMCNFHELTEVTIGKSINAIADNADVDWFLINKETTGDSLSGSNKKGTVAFDIAMTTNKTTVTTNVTVNTSEHGVTSHTGANRINIQGNNHQCLLQIMQKIVDQFKANETTPEEPNKQYDYVVLEFDGSRIFPSYTRNATVETQAATYLKPLYEKGQVIWIVDDNTNDEDWSFADKQDYALVGAARGKGYYRPTSYCFAGGSSNTASDDQYCGLVALLDPEKYLATVGTKSKSTLQRTTGKLNMVKGNNHSSITVPTATFSANAWNTNQIGYAHCDEVSAYLAETIKPVAYNLAFNDKIMADVGLSLTGMKFYCATNDLASDSDQWWEMVSWDAANPEVYDRTGERYWTQQLPELGSLNIKLTQVDSTSNRVEVTMTNMWIETWAKIDVGLVDDGTFKTSVDATYNPVTGQWEKNPNEGMARVAMVDEQGHETEVKGQAATAAAWKFNTYDVTTEVENGEIFLNGLDLNKIAFCEGYSPVVSYRGKRGYDLARLYVDSDLYTQEDFNDTNRVYTLFSQLASSHSVRAEYLAFVEAIESAPATNTYDGAAHVFPVEVKVVEGADYEIDVRYALEADRDNPTNYLTAAEFCVTNREALKDVGPHEIYYKVFALQQGYGASIDQKGWVEVGVRGKEIGGGVNTNWVEAATLYATAGSTYITSKDESWAITNGPVIAFSGFVTNTIGGVTYAEDAANALDFGGKMAQQCLECADFVAGATAKGTHPIVIAKNAIAAVKGNYLIRTYPGTLYVDGVPFVINGQPQDGTEDPEDDNGPIAVKSVTKVYDGIGTSIVIRVDWPTDFPSDDHDSVFKFAPDNGYAKGSVPEDAWQDALPQFTNVVSKAKVWYRLEDDRCIAAITNYAYVTVLPRPIAVCSPDAEKAFDGDALHTPDEACGYVEGSLETVGGDRLEFWSRAYLTDVGTLPNEFTYEFKSGDPANYAVTCVTGTLKVVQAGMTIGRPGAGPEDEDLPKTYPVDQNVRLRPNALTNGVKAVVKEYDGEPTNIVVNVFNPKTKKPVSGLTYLYTTNYSDAVWQPVLNLVDVTGDGTGGIAVWFAVEDPQGNYAAVTNSEFVTITPRPATVKAASAEKVYDGKGLTTNGIESVEGFLEGQGAAGATMTPESVITNAGTQANAIATLTPLEGTKLSNYDIMFVPGLLEVTKRPLTITTPDKSAEYEKGKTLTFKADEVKAEGYVDGESFVYSNFAKLTDAGQCEATCDIDEAKPATALFANYEITKKYGTLVLGGATLNVGGREYPEDPKDWPKADPDPEKNASGVDPVVKYYDGNPTSVTVKVVYPMGDPDETVEYSTDGGQTWTTEKPMFTTEIGTNEFLFAVGVNKNYNYITNTAYVIILRRPVTVIADDQTMTYGDEPPDLEGRFSVSNRVADTYNVSLDYTNEVFGAGVSTNAIVTNAAIWVEHQDRGDVTSCYDITFVPGTLTVRKGEAPEYGVTSVTNVFNYLGTNVTVTAEEGAEIWWKVNGEWTRVPPAYTNVGTYRVEFKVVDPSGNREDAFGKGEVVIKPLPITITADDQNKVFGKENPMPELTWKVKIDGTDETIPTNDIENLVVHIDRTGIEKVGDNNIHVSGEREQGNYVITYVDGTLHVTDKQLIGYMVKGAEVMYDGLGHRIEAVCTNAELQTGHEIRIGYSLTKLAEDAAEWQPKDAMPATTNVSEYGGTLVYFIIKVDDGSKYATVIDSARVMVLKRPVMLKAADGEWQHDGMAHGTNGFEVVEGIGGFTNFVALAGRPAEGLKSVTMTADSTITDIGETNNVILAGSEVPNEVTLLSNYTFAYSNGVLKVTEGRKQMPLKGIDPVEVYYDGEGHMIKPQFDWGAAGEPKDLEITYSNEKEGAYVRGLEATNVVESGTYWFKATASGYFETNGWATVTINKRSVQLQSQSGSWEYDGKGHGTNEVFEITAYDGEGGHGFVPGEGVTTNSFAEVTNVVDTATGNNTFKYELTEKTSEKNYEIGESVYGDLEITPYDSGYEVLGVTNAVYSGKAYEPRPEIWATNLVDKLLLVETNDYELAWVNNTNATDNTESKVAFVEITLKGNYKGVVTQMFEIARAPVTVKGQKLEKAKGQPDPAAVHVATVKGLVNGESESLVKYNATRPTEGEEEGVGGPYEITVEAQKFQGNYEVKTVHGELWIVDRDILVKADDIVFIYNGTEANPVVTVQNQSVTNSVVEFLWGDGTWREDAPSYKNVISGYDHRTNVVYRVRAWDEVGELIPMTNFLVVSIQPREITLTMGNGNHQELAKQKVYDGTPLWGEASDIQVGGLGYAPGEEFLYGWFTNRIEVGINPSSFDWHDNSNEVTHVVTLVSNYTVKPEYGWLKILPPENAITVYSANAFWEYDGETHPFGDEEKAKYYKETVDYGVPLAPGHYLNIVWSNATLKAKGLVLNDFGVEILNAAGENVTTNYTVIKAAGTFEMKAARINENDLIARSYRGIYDGQPTNVTVQVTNELVLANNPKVWYSLDTTAWTDDIADVQFTNVTDGSVKVWYKVTSDNFEDYAPMQPLTLQILPRPVEFESLDIYAASPATIPDETHPLAVVTNGAYGVVAGDVFTFTPTNTLGSVGSADAAFRWDASATVSNNYAVTVRYGKLVVMASGALTIRAASTNFVYEIGKTNICHRYEVVGEAEGDVTVEGAYFTDESRIAWPTDEGQYVPNVITSVVISSASHKTYASTNFIDGKLTMSPAKFTDVTVVTTNVVYDGGFYYATVTSSVPGIVVSYNTTGPEANYSLERPEFRNANEYGYPVYYKVTRKGYEPYTGVTSVRITQRPITICSASVTNVYDGTGLTTHGQSGAVWVSKTEGMGLVGGDLLAADTPLAVTNVCTSPNTFVHAITNALYEGDLAGNYYVTPKAGTLVIEPYRVTLVMKTKDKVFDGKTAAEYLSDNLATLALPVDGGATKAGALALGDGVIGTDLTFAFVDPNVGFQNASNNTFKAEWVVTNCTGAFRNNYLVTDVKVIGAKIIPAKMPDPDDGPRDPKDPQNHPEAGPFDGPNLPGGPKAPPAPGDATYPRLSDYDIVTNYDGQAHTFDTNALYAALELISSTNGYFSQTYEVWYSLDGMNWANEPYAWANVADTPTSFWYRVSAPNMTNLIHAVGVTVTNRLVRIESGTKKDFAYDGNPHAYTNLTVETATAEEIADGKTSGFVPGDGLATTTDWATVTTVEEGERDNTFKYTLNEFTDPDNYAITVVTGKIAISAGGFDDTDVRTYVGQYDGRPHSVVGTAVPAEGTTVEYSLDGGSNWALTNEFTDVTNVTVLVRFTNPNYETAVEEAVLAITPRKITLEGPDKSKPYDGAKLTFAAGEIKAGGSLFAQLEDGTYESFAYDDFSSVTEVGRTRSVFRWSDGTAKLSNYEVTFLDDHWLEVTPNGGQIVVRSLDGEWSYDGTAHVAGMETNNVELIADGDELVVNYHGDSVKLPGSVSNTFDVAIMRGDADVTAYYPNLLAVTGVLRVVNAKFVEPAVTPYNELYDGAAHNVEVTPPEVDGVKAEYLDGPFTDVTNATVRYVLTAPYYDAYTNVSTVSIRPRHLVFTSTSDSKKYDGRPLETNAGAIEVGGDGFAPEAEAEGVTFAPAASITEVGSTNADFTVTFDEKKAKSANYTFEKKFGALVIRDLTKRTIVAASHTFDYTGEEETWKKIDAALSDALEPGDGIATVTFAESSRISKPSDGEVPNVITDVTVTNADGRVQSYAFEFIPGTLRMNKGDLSAKVTAEGVEKVYDSFGTNITVTVDELLGGVEPKVTYSLNPNGPFKPSIEDFRDLTDGRVVYFMVEADEYEPYSASATVTVTARAIRLVSPSASKPYDGAPLSSNEVWLAEGEGLFALADNDYLDYVCTAAQTVAGVRQNDFDFAITNAAGEVDLAKNYAISFDRGNLTVEKRMLKVTPDRPTVAYGDPAPDYTYAITGFVNGEREADVVKGSATFTSDYEQYGSKAGETFAIRKAATTLAAENYGFEYVPVSFKVGKAQMEYDIPDIVTTYDGIGTNTVVKDMSPGSGVIYRTDDGYEGDVPPAFTNAGTYEVVCVVTNANFDTVTVTNTIVISPRHITLKSADDSKAFDGEPLLTDTNKITVGGIGYAVVNGVKERFDYFNPASITEVGFTDAKFEYRDGTAKLANYVVDEVIFGALTVNGAEGAVVLTSDSATYCYDKQAHGTAPDAWKVTTGADMLAKDGVTPYITLKGCTISTPGDPVTNEFASATVVFSNATDDVSARYAEKTSLVCGLLKMTNAVLRVLDPRCLDINRPYDGSTTNVSVEAAVALPPGLTADDLTVAYAPAAAGPFAEDANPDFLNATNRTEVWYVVSAEGCDPCTNVAYVTITPRKLVFKSADGSKVWNGSPLTTDAAAVKDVSGAGYGEGFAPEEGVKTFVSTGSITDVGSTNAEFDVVFRDNTLPTNYSVEKKFGTLTVRLEDEVIVYAGSHEFAFTGAEQRWPVIDRVEGLPSGFRIAETNFAAASRITYPSQNPVGNVITSIRLLNAEGDDVTQKYLDDGQLRFVDGELTVKAIPFQGVTAESWEDVYDGEAHEITVKVPEQIPAVTPKVSYCDSKDGIYRAENYGYAEANAEAAHTVWFKVEADGYETILSNATVKVLPRPLMIETPSETRAYDGTVLSNGDVKVVTEIGPMNMGLVEGHVFVGVTSSWLKDAGRTPNVCENGDYTIADAAGAFVHGNYYVTVSNGVLQVTPAVVIISFAAKDKVYDATTNAVCASSSVTGVVTGECLGFTTNGISFYFDAPEVGGHTVTAVGYDETANVTAAEGTKKGNYSIVFKPTTIAEIIKALLPDPESDDPEKDPDAGPFDGPDLDDPHTPPLPGDGGYAYLSDYDVITNYDGAAHTFDTNALFAKLDGMRAAGKFLGNPYEVAYSLTGAEGSWQSAPFAWTNVVETPTSFWYRVVVPNFTNYIHAVGVTVTQKVVTIAFEAADKVYDGKTDATCTATNFEGVVAGEALTLDVSKMSFAFEDATVGDNKTVTAEGYEDGFVGAGPDTRVTNYSFDFIETTRANITKGKPHVDPITDDDDRIYTGEEQKPLTPEMVKDDEGEQIPESEYEVEYFDNVHATNLAYVVVTFTNNYSGVITNYFKINRRPVTLVSGDHVFTYNGKDQVWSNVTVKAGEKLYGFVEGEGVTTNNFATVKDVTKDKVANKFEVSWNEGTRASDYNLQMEYGKISVVAAPINPKEPDTGDEPPENPTPEEPGNTDPPAETDGPTLWAPNVAKVYDGLPTNTEARVYNADGNTFGYLYTTNAEEDVSLWTPALDLVDVLRDADGKVTSYKVYYCATNYEGNLIGTNCFSYVTILPRKLTGDENALRADDTNLVYGTSAPDLAKHTWTGPVGLVEGDGVASVDFVWTNAAAVAKLLPGDYAGFITTNAVAQPIVITNGTRDVTGNYELEFIPGALHVAEALVEIGGKGPFGPGDMPEPLGPGDDGEGETGVRNVTRTYDGEATNVTVEVTKPAEGATVRFRTEDGEWTDADAFGGFAEAGTNKVWYLVEAEGYETVSNYAWVVTLPRALAVTVTGHTNTVAFTGTEQKVTGYEVEFGDGLYDGKWIEFGGTAEVASTAVVEKKPMGLKAADFANTNGNFAVTFAVTDGWLTVTNAVISPKGPFGPDDPLPGPAAGPWAGAFNVVMEYTGTNGTNIVVKWGNVVPDGVPYESLQYTTNDLPTGPWVDDIQFTNVFYDADHNITSQKVWFAITFPNYETMVTNAYVTILPRMMWFGPDEKGEIHPQDPENPVPPNAYDDASGTSNGVRNVFKEYVKGETTNIVVNVVWPDMTDPAAGVEILYSTNGTAWVEWDAMQFEEPVLTQKVWYAVSAPNCQTVTNYGYVTIYKAEVEPVFPDMPLDEEDKAAVIDSLRNAETNDEGYGKHAYIKYKLTYGEAKKVLDYGKDGTTEETRTTREWGPAIEDIGKRLVSFAERETRETVATNFLYDVILERTYELWVATEDYEWRHWTNLTENVAHSGTFIAIPIKYEQPVNKMFLGIFGMHEGEMYQFEEITADEATEDGKLDPKQEGLHGYFVHDAANCKLTLYMRDFCPVLMPFKEAFKDALFTATLSWQFYAGTGSYFSDIKVTNTNDTDMIRYDKGTLRFCFADRIGANGTTLLALGDKVHRKTRWATTETIRGVTYRSYPLPDIDPSRADGGWTQGASKEYGTTGRLSDSVLTAMPSPEMFVYKRIAPEWGNEEAAWATEFVGWLVWNATDQGGTTRTYAIPLVADKQNLAVPGKAAFEGGPVSVEMLNENLAFGGEADEVSLLTTSFRIEGDTGRVRVAFLGGGTGRTVAPGASAEVIVLGAERLADPFEKIGVLGLDAKGEAMFKLGANQFFKFSATALQTVK